MTDAPGEAVDGDVDADVGDADRSQDDAGFADETEDDDDLADPNLADPNLANDDDGVANDGNDGNDDIVDVNEIPGARATDVLEYLVKELVDEPDAVEIDVDDGRRGLRMRVSVAPGDMGRVIGRRGRIANAIRTVVRAAAVDDGIAVDVDFVD
ncbi:MAG: KH domain-containing protein [Acidimicrobiales bacterium]